MFTNGLCFCHGGGQRFAPAGAYHYGDGCRETRAEVLLPRRAQRVLRDGYDCGGAVRACDRRTAYRPCRSILRAFSSTTATSATASHNAPAIPSATAAILRRT